MSTSGGLMRFRTVALLVALTLVAAVLTQAPPVVMSRALAVDPPSRFTSPDPIGHRVGQPFETPYAYASNIPTSRTDRSGLCAVNPFADDSCTSQLAAAVPGSEAVGSVLTGAVAVADVATMGATQTIRSVIGLGGAINECSTAYKATIGVATVASLAVPVLGGARFAVTKATQIPAMAAKAARVLPEAVAAARTTATTAKESTKVWAAARAEKAKNALAGLASRTRLTTTARAEATAGTSAPLFSKGGLRSNADVLANGGGLPRTMDTVHAVAGRAGVGLDDVPVQLLDDADDVRFLDENRWATGITDRHGIGLGPAAFADEETLVRTLGHERTHWMQLQLYGNSSALTSSFEQAAYGIEDSFVWYWRTGGLGG